MAKQPNQLMREYKLVVVGGGGKHSNSFYFTLLLRFLYTQPHPYTHLHIWPSLLYLHPLSCVDPICISGRHKKTLGAKLLKNEPLAITVLKLTAAVH
jgi:hypothetical protein